ncbi:MAG TPA: FHA domain-containing protein [Armatimonadota bacterium]|nr:FHA domain-containing protein [Armatimonadota bacterium]
MAQCPTCGSEVAEGAAFCPDCGTDLVASSAPTQGAPAGTPATPEAAGGGASPAPEAAAAMPEAPPTAGPELSEQPDSGGASAPPPAAPSAPPAPPAPGAPSPPAPPAPPQAAGGARLTLKRGGSLTGEVFPVSGRVIIGRFDVESGPVDVDLGPLPESNYVSRHHAEVWSGDGGQWFVKDLGSRNGTFVRSAGQGQFRKAEGEQQIVDGDEIALGNARFEFRTG